MEQLSKVEAQAKRKMKMSTNRCKGSLLLRENTRLFVASLFLLSGLFLSVSCGKKTVPLPTPKVDTSESVIEPEISVKIEPAVIKAGESAVIQWQVKNADTVVIDGGIGTVGLSGNRTILPKASTVYTVTAQGYGKTKTAQAEIRVQGKIEAAALPPPVSEPAGNVTIEELFAGKVKDIFFEYDRYELSQEAVEILYVNAAFFREYPSLNFIISGHCDERGTAEYNLALGERRAKGVKDFLVNIGIDPRRITTISYGEEKPFMVGTGEESFVQNRRAHFELNPR